MPDRMLVCVDCGNEFAFTEKDQRFFASKQFADPKRCRPCRDLKRQSRPKQDQQRG
jgi:putative zinc ribbon protein